MNDKVFLYHTLVWPPPATLATPPNTGHDFSDMFQGLLESLDDVEEGSTPHQHRHFPAMSVGGPAPSNAGSSNQPVLNVQGDMTVSGIVRAQQFLPLSDENAKCDIRKADHDALSLLEQLNIYQYCFKSSPEGRQILGLLAQEVGKVAPDFVETDDNGHRLDTNSLLSLSIQGIQQLWAQQQDIGSRLSFVLLKLSSLSKHSVLTPEASVSTPNKHRLTACKLQQQQRLQQPNLQQQRLQQQSLQQQVLQWRRLAVQQMLLKGHKPFLTSRIMM